MSEVTNGTEYVCLEHGFEEIGGTKIPMSIEGEVEYTHTHYPAQGMSGRMEDAIPSSDEITLDSVDLTVTLFGESTPFDGYPNYIQFKTNSIEFYEKHFGVLESEDVSL